MIKKLVALVLALLMVASTASAEITKGFTMYHGSREDKRVCITIDDLKLTEWVQAIFDLGQELDVPMTFFVLGYVLEDDDADMWRAIAESNCEIGNHTYNHADLPLLGASDIIANLNRTQNRLDEVLGYHYQMRVMRPPFGHIHENGSSYKVSHAVDKAGYEHMVLWDVSETDPAKCYRNVQNGSILLFHSMPNDLHCLEELLPRLIEDGYEFLTVSQMAELSPAK